MRANRAIGRTRRAWPVIITSLVVITGCSNGTSATSTESSGTTTAVTASPVASDTPSPEPSTSPSPSSLLRSKDPAATVGTVVLTEPEATLACETTDSSSPNLRSSQLLAGGRVVVRCGDGSRTMIDIFAGTVLWRMPSDTSDLATITTVVGSQHLFRLVERQIAASGLKGAYVTADLEAYDLSTGSLSWNASLEPDLATNDIRGGSQKLWEDQPVTGSSKGLVVVSRNRYNAFDAATGKAAWHVDKVSGTYVGSGIVIDRENNQLTATQLPAAKLLWSKPTPDFADSSQPTDLIGAVAWWIEAQGVYAIDLPSGRQVLNRLFPTTWHDHVATPELVLAFDGKQLQAFRTIDIRTPLWSAPGDNLRPLAVSRGAVIVRAESGDQVLDGANGNILTQATTPTGLDASTLVDGLVMTEDGVYELSPPGAA